MAARTQQQAHALTPGYPNHHLVCSFHVRDDLGSCVGQRPDALGGGLDFVWHIVA